MPKGVTEVAPSQTIDNRFLGVSRGNKLKVVSISLVSSMTSEGHKGHQSSEKEKVLWVGLFRESMAGGHEHEVSLWQGHGVCFQRDTR